MKKHFMLKPKLIASLLFSVLFFVMRTILSSVKYFCKNFGKAEGLLILLPKYSFHTKNHPWNFRALMLKSATILATLLLVISKKAL